MSDAPEFLARAYNTRLRLQQGKLLPRTWRART